MKTLIKNRQTYRRWIGPAGQSDGEQGPDNEEGEKENADKGGNTNGEGEGNTEEKSWYTNKGEVLQTLYLNARASI